MGHLLATFYINYFGQTQFDSFYKFTIVRNPAQLIYEFLELFDDIELIDRDIADQSAEVAFVLVIGQNFGVKGTR
jgi:hypothetical protein